MSNNQTASQAVGLKQEVKRGDVKPVQQIGGDPFAFETDSYTDSYFERSIESLGSITFNGSFEQKVQPQPNPTQPSTFAPGEWVSISNITSAVGTVAETTGKAATGIFKDLIDAASGLVGEVTVKTPPKNSEKSAEDQAKKVLAFKQAQRFNASVQGTIAQAEQYRKMQEALGIIGKPQIDAQDMKDIKEENLDPSKARDTHHLGLIRMSQIWKTKAAERAKKETSIPKTTAKRVGPQASNHTDSSAIEGSGLSTTKAA